MWPPTLVVVLVSAEVISNAAATTAFGCKNSLITDEWREKVLNFHNNYRQRVSEGQQVSLPGKVMPVAKDMMRLNWDCNIEHNAWLYSCDNTVNIPANYAVLSGSIKMPNKNCDISQITTDKLKGWWNEVTTQDLSAVSPQYDASIKDFAQMVNAKATGFACTYNKCGSDGKLVCIYNKEITAGELYTASATATDACTCDPQNKITCINKLCEGEYTLDTKTTPQPQCPNSQMTADLEEIAEDMHNYYRRLVATGWAKDKKAYAKWASKMNSLKTDCTIADSSKALADDCTAQSYTAKGGYSLNFHKESYSVSVEDTLKNGIEAWFKQLATVDLDDKATFNDNIEQNAPKFANMMQQDTTSLGCSVKQCLAQGFTVAVCQYNGIPSNGDPLYTVGKTCSKCQTCDKLGGLCA